MILIRSYKNFQFKILFINWDICIWSWKWTQCTRCSSVKANFSKVKTWIRSKQINQTEIETIDIFNAKSSFSLSSIRIELNPEYYFGKFLTLIPLNWCFSSYLTINTACAQLTSILLNRFFFWNFWKVWELIFFN